MDEFTDNEIYFACALTPEWQVSSRIKCQARDNGHAIERVSLRMLKARDVVEIWKPYSSIPRLRRGKNWGPFFNKHGTEETRRGLLGLEIRHDISCSGFYTPPLPQKSHNRYSGRAHCRANGPIRLFQAKPKLTLVLPSASRE